MGAGDAQRIEQADEITGKVGDLGSVSRVPDPPWPRVS